MENGATYEALKEIIERYAPSDGAKSPIAADTTLEDMGIDSPRRIDILLDIEDHFTISIEDDQFDKVKTFGDLVSLIDTIAAAS